MNDIIFITAIGVKDEKSIRMMLQSGFNPNTIAVGSSVLDHALEINEFTPNPSPSIVALLLEAGANPNLISPGKTTLPINAVIRNMPYSNNPDYTYKIIELLINAGADIRGSIHALISNDTYHRYPNMMRLLNELLRRGSDVNWIENNLSVLQMALLNSHYIDHEEIVDLLLKAGANPRSAIVYPVLYASVIGEYIPNRMRNIHDNEEEILADELYAYFMRRIVKDYNELIFKPIIKEDVTPKIGRDRLRKIFINSSPYMLAMRGILGPIMTEIIITGASWVKRRHAVMGVYNPNLRGWGGRRKIRKTRKIKQK